jgi:hypothetical protein
MSVEKKLFTKILLVLLHDKSISIYLAAFAISIYVIFPEIELTHRLLALLLMACSAYLWFKE